jgi:hypothetical protein
MLAFVLTNIAVEAGFDCSAFDGNTCFQGHDEFLIFDSRSLSECCSNCSNTPKCNVWTFRDGKPSTCHLRTSWGNTSIPVPGPCKTGVRDGPLPGPTPPPAPTPAPPTPPTESVITVVNKVTQPLNPLIMGCHTDLGYDHQIYGFYSQVCGWYLLGTKRWKYVGWQIERFAVCALHFPLCSLYAATRWFMVNRLKITR